MTVLSGFQSRLASILPPAKASAAAPAPATPVTGSSALSQADSFVRQAPPVNAPALVAATQGVAAAQRGVMAQLTAQAAQLAAAPSDAVAGQVGINMQQLQQQASFLGGMKALGDRLLATPGASANAVTQLGFMLAQANGLSSTQDQELLITRAQDLVRNAARPTPSDRGVANASIGLVMQRGALVKQMVEDASQMAQTSDPASLQKLSLDIGELQQAHAFAGQMKVLGDRLANQPNPSPAAAAQLTSLMTYASQVGLSGEAQATLLEQAKDVVRNASRTTPSDRGLFNATLNIVNAQATCTRAMFDDALQMANSGNAAIAQQFELDRAQLQTRFDALGKLRDQADRLADNPATTADAAKRMSQLLASGANAQTPSQVTLAVARATQIQ